MPLDPAVKAELESKLEQESDKAAQQEKGCGTGVVFHFDGPKGAFAGYTVSTEIDGGLTHTFARVNTTVKPDDSMIETIHRKYSEDVIVEIKERREAKKIVGIKK